MIILPSSFSYSMCSSSVKLDRSKDRLRLLSGLSYLTVANRIESNFLIPNDGACSSLLVMPSLTSFMLAAPEASFMLDPKDLLEPKFDDFLLLYFIRLAIYLA